jgi:hypothetical protein
MFAMQEGASMKVVERLLAKGADATFKNKVPIVSPCANCCVQLRILTRKFGAA